MNNWEYGEAYKKYNINDKSKILFEDGSQIKVHDIYDDIPEFMKNADIIFTDSPWNTGNLNTFYTKAQKEKIFNDFTDFYNRLFECIEYINPKICYLEIGKEFLSNYIMKMKKIYKYVTFYNSSYYHKKENICYVVRGSNKYKKPKLDYMDEENIIEYVCKNEDYKCIGDLCMGRGLVGLNAYKNNKRFVGTELNYKRLSVLVDRIVKYNKEVIFNVL